MYEQFWSWLSEPEAPPLIAFLGVVASASIAAIISSRASYISAVTAERAKWIERTRQAMAELLDMASALHRLPHTTSPGLKNEIDGKVALLQMQLNPWGKIENNIITLLKRLPSAIEGHGAISYRDLEAALVQHMQHLMKAEWEKIKAEASPFPYSFNCSAKRDREDAAQRYREFLKTPSSQI